MMETEAKNGGTLREVDGAEIISIVDNTVDFLSATTHKQVKPFGRWARERHGQEWMHTHKQFPLAEHGFSMLIRTLSDNKPESILFDAGGSPETAVENARRVGLDLKEVECIVLSHGHYDHFGGLISVVKEIGRSGIPIIVHDDMFKSRGSAYPDGAVRKYTDFPTEAQLSPARLVSTKKPFLVAHNKVCVTGEIPRETSFEKGFMRHRALTNGEWQPDPAVLDDRGVVLNVKGKGLVVLSGCAHAGIINTVNYAKQITGIPEVYAVIGGFHLAGKENEKRIEQTINELKRINPKLVVPCHCTGWKAMCALSQEMPDAFVWNSVGNLYEV
ncbi:MAG: MBL fold metallo-hydrolase [Candidatus Bathyarchaeota archaeon]|nr:MBL fold metallo-hydrolase [Candidatus Bathyarchaeota archaeon]